MSKRFSWEVDKTSLILRVTDGAKETTWKIRKNSHNEVLRTVFEELQLAMWVPSHSLNEEYQSMKPLTASEEDWEESSSVSTSETSEEASKAALQAQVDKLNVGAQWWDTEDEVYTTDRPIADYDAGEI